MKDKGLGLPMILGACGILAMATGIVGAYAVSNLNALSKEQLYDQAHYGSFSGIQYALDIVTEHPEVSSPVSASPPYAIPVDGNMTFSSNPELTGQVFIYSNLPTANPMWTQAPDGTNIPPGVVYIVAQTTMRGGVSLAKSAQMTALCTPTQFNFDRAAFGNSQVTVTGTSVLDSFSGLPYAAPASPNKQAGIATNEKTTAAALTIGPAAYVDGDAQYGPMGAPAVYSGPANASSTGSSTPGLTGNSGTLSAPITFKLDHPPGSGTVTLAGNHPGAFSLQAGKVYIVNGDLNMDAGDSFTVTPNPSPQGVAQENDAIVFVKGDINLVNCNQVGDMALKPERLQFYQAQNGTHTFKMDNSKGSFVMGGPSTTAQVINGSVLQGALMADKLTVDNSQIHYDSTLLHKPLGPASWAVGGFDSDNKKPVASGSVAPGPGPGPGPGPAPPGPGPGPAPPGPAPAPTTTTSTTSSTASSMLP